MEKGVVCGWVRRYGCQEDVQLWSSLWESLKFGRKANKNIVVHLCMIYVPLCVCVCVCLCVCLCLCVCVCLQGALIL